jgi:threonine aldolase
MNKLIDLRSDTVTKPTKEMLEYMFNAAVGDDVFGEDETVNKLEKKVADMFGKEAGLFCPSGTMTNQIAIKMHTQPGDEVICDTSAHIYNFEGGGISRNSGVQARLIQGDRGRISAAQIVECINADFDWLTRTRLVEIENTCNRAGGSYYDLAVMQDMSSLCKKHQLAFHLDGARIFNAIVEAGYTSQQVGSCFDSVSVCLSKGLGAPVGSVLVGTKEQIKQARRIRKVFGGGMRQAGYLAAACIFALDHHVNRLKEDHKKASEIAGILTSCSYIKSILPVETNIIIFTLNEDVSSEKFAHFLSQNNIKTAAFGKQTYRLVTHLDITEDMMPSIEKTLKGFVN